MFELGKLCVNAFHGFHDAFHQVNLYCQIVEVFIGPLYGRSHHKHVGTEKLVNELDARVSFSGNLPMSDQGILDGKSIGGARIAFRGSWVHGFWTRYVLFVFGKDFLGFDEHAAFLAKSTVLLLVFFWHIVEEALWTVNVINPVFYGGAAAKEDDRKGGVSIFVKLEGALVTDFSLTAFTGSLAVKFYFARFKQFSGSHPIWMEYARLRILDRFWTISHDSTLRRILTMSLDLT